MAPKFPLNNATLPEENPFWLIFIKQPAATMTRGCHEMAVHLFVGTASLV